MFDFCFCFLLGSLLGWVSVLGFGFWVSVLAFRFWFWVWVLAFGFGFGFRVPVSGFSFVSQFQFSVLSHGIRFQWCLIYFYNSEDELFSLLSSQYIQWC